MPPSSGPIPGALWLSFGQKPQVSNQPRGCRAKPEARIPLGTARAEHRWEHPAPLPAVPFVFLKDRGDKNKAAPSRGEDGDRRGCLEGSGLVPLSLTPPGQRQAPQRGLRLVLQRGRLVPGVNVNGAELLGETLRFSL